MDALKESGETGVRSNETELCHPSEIIQKARELGESFATRAAHYDREGTFPVENFKELKEAGFMGLMIPKEYGGLGADFLTYTRALEQIAIGDAATGLTFNMHNIAVGSIGELNLDGVGGSRGRAMKAFCEWTFDQAVNHQRVFASASSEPGIGAHFSKLKTTYKRVEDGFIVNGQKSFVSMSGYADYYVIAAKSAESSSDVPAISFLVAHKDTPGIRIENTWDVMGMRSTETNFVHLEDVYIPKSQLFLASEGMALYKIAREPHWLVGGYTGVYLGICTAAFRFLVDFLKKKKLPGTDIPQAEDPRIQARVGELYSSLESARTVVYNAAMMVSKRPGTTEANTAIHNAKYLVSELGPWLSSQAIRMCGASSLSKKLPLERFYRDSRCGGLMPATSDECLMYLGKSAFGANLTQPSETYW